MPQTATEALLLLSTQARVQQSLGKSWGCPMQAHGQQGAWPRCMSQSITNVQKCRARPPAVFQQAGAEGPAPGGCQGALKP